MPPAFWRGDTNGFEKTDVRFKRTLFSNLSPYICKSDVFVLMLNRAHWHNMQSMSMNVIHFFILVLLTYFLNFHIFVLTKTAHKRGRCVPVHARALLSLSLFVYMVRTGTARHGKFLFTMSATSCK